MFTFGRVPTYQSTDEFGLDISDDRRAFTLSFSDLQVSLQGGKSAEPMSERDFSIVVPIEGQGSTVEIEFGVGGAALTTENATATMVFSVNGQTTVADFAEGSDESFVRQLKFAAKSPSECRLSIFLVGGRDSNVSDAAASLNVLSVDAEILPRPK